MTIYERYCQMNIDGRWINLEKTEENIEYFCTPIGVDIIGWENGGIHYCFIAGYGEMVFAVNPETCAESYVYPLAKNFEDFLRLILACGSTTVVEQIILWDKEQFEKFLHSEDNPIVQEQREILDRIQSELNLTPMEYPFEYVKEVQAQFDDSKIKFKDEYYDVLGLEKVLTEQIANMEVNDITVCTTENHPVYLDRTEKDNSKWLELITEALKNSKRFEIHCWNEENDWIKFALQYGTLKESDWKYGKIIEGEVTPEFVNMILGMPKPTDVEIYNKMTPFFNIFLDDYDFQSSHYGTEIYIKEK